MAKTMRWKRRANAGEGSAGGLDEPGGHDAPDQPDDQPDDPPDDQPDDQPEDPSEDTPEDPPVASPEATPADPANRRERRVSVPLLLVAAAHPRQAVLTALAVGSAAALAGRPAREVGVVLLTVLVGQSVLGWHNDLFDRARDARHQSRGKPIADGRLDPGTVWFALACGVLLVVPLSITTGVTAGSCYLLALVMGLLGNVLLRTGFFSWVPWAVSFALYPAYLSYGGWGGSAQGAPPEVALSVLAGLLGIGVHFLRSLWGLVPDHQDGWTYLPLRLGRRIGAAKLLWATSVLTVGVLAAMAYVASTAGLSQ